MFCLQCFCGIIFRPPQNVLKASFKLYNFLLVSFSFIITTYNKRPGATSLTKATIAITLIKSALQYENQNILTTTYMQVQLILQIFFYKSSDFNTHIFIINTKPLFHFSIRNFSIKIILYPYMIVY